MGLNIKNTETERLVQELSRLTGESLTGAVTEAVRERIERLRAVDRQDPGSLADHLLTIGKDTASRLPDVVRSADHGDLLYDDAGLPR